MSDVLTQQRRKSEAIRDAAELIQESKPDAERLTVAMAELLIGDEDKIAAIVYELAEMTSRLDRTVDHISDQVIASQDAEIRTLKGRIAKLEKSRTAKKQ